MLRQCQTPYAVIPTATTNINLRMTRSLSCESIDSSLSGTTFSIACRDEVHGNSGPDTEEDLIGVPRAVAEV